MICSRAGGMSDPSFPWTAVALPDGETPSFQEPCRGGTKNIFRRFRCRKKPAENRLREVCE